MFDSVEVISAFLLAGFALRNSAFASRVGAAGVFRLVFLVTLPALVLSNIGTAELDRQNILLPLTGFAICATCAIAAAGYGKIRRLPTREARTLVLSAGICNLLFTYPLVTVILGPDALTTTILIDLGNALFTAVVANKIAIGDFDRPVLRVTRTPLFLAALLAVAVNLTDVPVPETVFDILDPVGSLTLPLTMIGLGLSVSFGAWRSRLVYRMLLFRMGIGFLVGSVIALNVAVDEATAAIIIASASAPIGFSAATFSSLGGLDLPKVTLAISVSALVGLLTVPAILILGPGLL